MLQTFSSTSKDIIGCTASPSAVSVSQARCMARPTTRSVASVPSGAEMRQSPEALSTSCFAFAAKIRPVLATRCSQSGVRPISLRAKRSAADNSSEAGQSPSSRGTPGGGVEANLGQERPSHAGFAEHQGVGAADQAGQRREPVGADDPPGETPSISGVSLVMRSRTGPGTGRPS